MRIPQLQLDFSEIRNLFRKGDTRFLREVKRAWQRAGMFFISDIVKNQMSGRVAPNYGLNIVHGQLRRSWYPFTEIQSGDVVSKIQTDSPYARPHQYGSTIMHPARQRILTFRRTRSGVRFTKDKLVTSAGKRRNQFQKSVTTGAYEIKIPKRLYIIERFKTEGLRLYVTELRQALQMYKKGKQ